MAIISVSDLTFGYDGSVDLIFEHVSFQLDTDWRLGLTGRNGRGKTTLLKLLLGQMEYRGRIVSSAGFDYFPFSVEDETEDTLSVLASVCPDCPQWRLLRELSLLEMDEEALWRPFRTLSNGERTKALLCALFLKENRFLLIDEPTNHLDLHGREILSRYLARQKGFILVSHDRAFLDGCIDHVLSINKTTVEVRKGNYSTWEENKERKEAFERREQEKLRQEIRQLEKSARTAAVWSDRTERTKYGTTDSGLKPDRGYVGHKAAKLMKRSKCLEARRAAAVEEVARLMKNVETAESLKLPCLPYFSDRLVELRDVSVAYDGRTIFQNVGFSIERGERVVLRGRNGAGKSSLLRLICGEDIPHSGSIRLGSRLKISCIPQDTAQLRGNLAVFIERYGLDETLFKAILRKLDFSREQFDKPMEHYSGGQKKKVLLAKSLCEPAHLYVWDEPLNFIDVISRVQIEELLLSACPSLLFVEHDGVFCDRIATKEICLGHLP